MFGEDGGSGQVGSIELMPHLGICLSDPVSVCAVWSVVPFHLSSDLSRTTQPSSLSYSLSRTAAFNAFHLLRLSTLSGIILLFNLNSWKKVNFQVHWTTGLHIMKPAVCQELELYPNDLSTFVYFQRRLFVLLKSVSTLYDFILGWSLTFHFAACVFICFGGNVTTNKNDE